MEQGQKSYTIDMCNGPILQKMLKFSIPLMFSSILQLLFNAADIIVVGRFAGDECLAAVGSTGSLINLLVNLFVGLSVGVNVLTATYYGAKQEKDLSQTVHTAMLLSIFSGLFLATVGAVGARQILTWMSSPENILPLSTKYLRIYFFGMPAMMIYNFGSAILRAVGDTKRPLYFLLIAGVINVILNLIFVIIFKLDVAGVAFATVISQFVSATLIVICMIKEKGAIRLVPKNLRIYSRKLLKILKIGLPAGFQGILFSLSNVIIQSSVNSFGAIVIAGNSASQNIEGFVYVSMNSLYQATISFTGQNRGAKKYKRIDKILLTAQLCVFVLGLLLGNTVVFFGENLLGIYSKNPLVIQAGLRRLSIIASTYAACGMMDVMVGAMRGLGYSIMPMIVSLLGACCLRIVWIATIFQIEQFHTIKMLYISYPVSWVVTFCAHVFCYFLIKHKIKRTDPSLDW